MAFDLESSLESMIITIRPVDRSGGQPGQVESRYQPPSRVRQLQARVDRLSMICQAMWELLRDKAKLTDEDVIKQMQQIDLRDGVEDGKMTRQTLVCPECGRNVSSRREQCLYCGTWLVKTNLFE